MTEYDYSPAAIQAHMAKQARIASWAHHASKHPPVNPFHHTPSTAAREPDFYHSAPSNKRRTRSKHRHRHGSRHGDYTDESDDDTDDDGPDRPPTPPASAPVGFGFGGYPGAAAAGGGVVYGASPYAVAPVGYAQQPLAYGYPYGAVPNSAPVAAAARQQPTSASTLMIPMWTGSGWVYQPAYPGSGGGSLIASPTVILPTPTTGDSSSHRRGHSHSRSHRRRGRSLTRRSTSHIVQSQSQPPAGVYGYLPPQAQYHQLQQQQQQPYSASGPLMYLPSGHTSPASQYTTLSAPPLGSAPASYPSYPGYQQLAGAGAGLYSMQAQPLSTAGVYSVQPSNASVYSHASGAQPVVILNGRERRERGKGESFLGKLFKGSLKV